LLKDAKSAAGWLRKTGMAARPGELRQAAIHSPASGASSQSGNSNQVVAQHQDGSLSRCILCTVSSCNRMRRMRSGITTASLHRLQQRPRLTGTAL
jgi:hypothetical protein